MKKHIKIDWYLEEPVKIVDVKMSKPGENAALKYIQGSTIRGAVISEIIKTNQSIFEELRVELLTEEVCFLNAYPLIDNEYTFPSIKGFYEDKAEEKIENIVVKDKNSEGFKRAKMGDFCKFAKEEIINTTINIEENLHINLNSNNKGIFRSCTLANNQLFRSYIVVSSEKCKDELVNILKATKYWKFGSSKTAGYGRVRLVNVEEDITKPSYGIKENIEEYKEYIYMINTSPLCMFSYEGKYCGIDKKELEEKLGVSNIELEKASTSIIYHSGKNSTWKADIPDIPMYESGSTFKIRFDGSLKREKIEIVENEGIGVRRAEGCGRVVFVRENLENIITKKTAEKNLNLIEEESYWIKDDEKALEVVNKGIYTNIIKEGIEKYIAEKSHEFKKMKAGISKSQLGILRNMCQVLKYTPEKAEEEIKKFFEHVIKKEEKSKKHFAKSSQNKFIEYIKQEILDKELFEILGLKDNKIFNKEKIIYKLEIITRSVAYYNRGEKIDD